MCGRFTHKFTWSQLHRLMRLTTGADQQLEFGERYNVAPTQSVPVVRQDRQGNRTAALLKWGLVPFWADDTTIGNRLINARSEEAATAPAFRAAAKQRRCLVPVSGFYEWQTIEGERAKRPWYITVKDAPIVALAGLWEHWDKHGANLHSFTILTGKPNPLVLPIHNRMPVIIRPEHYDRWLDQGIQDFSILADIIEPFPADQMEAFQVSTRVNAPKNDDRSLVERIA